MPATPPFTRIELSGPRRIIRQVLAWGLAASAAVAALGYVLPAHYVHGGWHSNYTDGGEFSLAVLVLVLGATLALRHRRFGSGMLTGVVAAGGAIAAIVPVILEHLFADVHYGIGESLFASGELGLFFGGIALFIAEPILYLVERRGGRRVMPPQVPLARVVA